MLPSDPTEWILAISMGIAFAAACGLRVFAPFFVVSFAIKFLGICVPAGLTWLSSWPAFACFCIAMLAEVVAYYVPWVDNVLDFISTPLALVGGGPFCVLQYFGSSGRQDVHRANALFVLFWGFARAA